MEKIITTASLLIAVVSMIAALRNTPWWNDLKYDKRRVITWNRFWQSFNSDNFINKFDENQFDIIIGLNDGIVPASILMVNNYGTELYYCETSRSEKGFLKNSTIDTQNSSSLGLQFPSGTPTNVNDKDILIVDDNFLTGRSMEAVVQFVKSVGSPRSITCRSLFQYENADKPNKLLNFRSGEFIDPRSSHTPKGIHVFRAPWSLSKTHQRRYDRGSKP